MRTALGWLLAALLLAGCSSLAQGGPSKTGLSELPADVHACAAAIVAAVRAANGSAINEPQRCYVLTGRAYVAATNEAARDMARSTP